MDLSAVAMAEDVKHACHQVVTHHGSILWGDRSRGELVHVGPGADTAGLVEARLFAPFPLPDSAVLFTIDESPVVWLFQLVSELSGPGLSFVGVRDRVLLTAEPLGSNGIGATVRTRHLAMPWEIFTTRPVPSTEVNWTLPVDIAILLDKLRATGGNLWTCETITELARAKKGLVIAVARHVSAELEPATLDRLATAVVRNSGDYSAFLEQAEPNDVWRTQAFAAHWAWVNGPRQPSREGHIAADLDVLDHQNPADSVLLGKRLIEAFRRQTRPTRTICIVSSVRNEGPYILEWLAYHKAIGVDHFFLYSNSNDDGSDDLLRELANAGEITWIRNEIGAVCRPQLKAFNHSLSMLPDTLDFRWTLMIDLDEFLVVNVAFGGLSNYLRNQELRRCDVIAFNWLFIGSSGQARRTLEPVTDRFRQNLGVDWHIKSAFKTNLFTNAGAHNPSRGDMNTVIMRDAAGGHYRHRPEGLPFAADPKADHAWINHYFYKSAEEFLWKNARNRGDQSIEGDRINWSMLSDAWIDGFLNQFGATVQNEDRRIEWWTGAMKNEAIRIAGNLHVRKAEAHVNEMASSRLERLRTEFLDYAAARGTSPQRAFARVLQV